MSRPILEDALNTFNSAGWWEYSDHTNKTYANVVVVDADATMPSEAEVNAKLAEMQAAHDAVQYQRNRASEYPSIGDQLDALFHAGVFPEEMAATIQAVKDKYPKESA